MWVIELSAIGIFGLLLLAWLGIRPVHLKDGVIGLIKHKDIGKKIVGFILICAVIVLTYWIITQLPA